MVSDKINQIKNGFIKKKCLSSDVKRTVNIVIRIGLLCLLHIKGISVFKK